MNRRPIPADVPVPPAELARWDAVITTAEECDRAAGITDAGTVNARIACGAARGAGVQR